MKIVDNRIHHYRVAPRWLLENLALFPGGKGPLRLCWGRGLTHWVVNTETQKYRLLSTWDHILTNNGGIPLNASLRCKRNGVRGKLTIHFTTVGGENQTLKVDEDLHITPFAFEYIEEEKADTPF